MNSPPYFHAELRVNLAIFWRDIGIQRFENSAMTRFVVTGLWYILLVDQRNIRHGGYKNMVCSIPVRNLKVLLILVVEIM